MATSERLAVDPIACRAHGLKFDMTHGCPHDPAKLQVRTHGLRVTDGMVMLDPDA